MASSHHVWRPSPAARRATSLTVSSPILRSMMSRPISTSPGFGLNGLRSTSQLRRRAPSLSSAAEAVGVDEDPPALAGGDEAEHARGDAGAAGNDDDVVEPADGRAAGVEQRQAHDPERVDQLACHAARLPPVPAQTGWIGRFSRSVEPALTSTSVSLNATPPPHSVSVSLVSELATLPSGW